MTRAVRRARTVIDYVCHGERSTDLANIPLRSLVHGFAWSLIAAGMALLLVDLAIVAGGLLWPRSWWYVLGALRGLTVTLGAMLTAVGFALAIPAWMTTPRRVGRTAPPADRTR